MPDRDGLHRAILASEDGQRLFSVQALKVNKLCIFAVVVQSSDEHLDEESDQNEDSLDPTGFGLYDHAGDDTEDGKDRHKEENAVVKTIFDGLEEGWLLVS